MEMDSQLQRLKQIELDILKAFCHVCDSNSLRYYIIGGTLLGAVRHQGFIPWDDDIDVAMPRPDYEKFMNIAGSCLPEYYFAQNYKSDPNYILCFGKIRDSRTTFIEKSIKNLKINHGVYIDVFPLDYYPTTNVALFKMMDSIYAARISCDFDSKPSKKMIILQTLSKCLCGSVNSAVMKRNKHMQSVTTSNLMANVCGAWGKKEIMPSEWFGEGIQLQFEGIYVRGPKKYHDYLTQVYGDYMTPPPKEKQIAHHYTEFIDLDNSYTKYTQ